MGVAAKNSLEKKVGRGEGEQLGAHARGDNSRSRGDNFKVGRGEGQGEAAPSVRPEAAGEL